MEPRDERLDRRLALVKEILEGAFFSPLHAYDWVGFLFGQPGLLELEEEEVFDFFVRGALAAEVIYPELARGTTPLGWLWRMEEPGPVLAHVLASMRADRPFVLHRLLMTLPRLANGEISPEKEELVEDFFKRVLGEGNELREVAETEISVLRRRGLMAAGIKPGEHEEKLARAANQLLARPEAAQLLTDRELLSWLVLQPLQEDQPPEITAGAVVEAWYRWVGAITGVRPDLGLLTKLMPMLGMDANELALYAPVERELRPVLEATCPYCYSTCRLELTPEGVNEQARCGHLVFVGTCDEMHIWQVLRSYDLGEDFHQLLSSYYNSAIDLELMATIVNDLFELLRGQGRLKTSEISCEKAPKAFYYLKAYFKGEPNSQ